MSDVGRTFGRKGAPIPCAKPQFHADAPKQRRGLKDYAFYTVIGVLVFFTVGFLALIFESPEARQAREAERVATIQRLQEAKAERAEEAERQQAARRETERLANRPPLRIDSFKCTKEHGFAKVYGTVTNRSERAIDKLMVTAVFTTSGGDVVKTSDAMIDFQPLMPGQRSPFSTLTTDNPAMKGCELYFRTMFGGKVEAE